MKMRISQSELDVMDVLWAKSPLAASDVAQALQGDKSWNIKTVKTLLARLVEKGALTTEPDGRRYLYTPTLSRESYAAKAARRLSDRLFGGKAAPLVAHLAQDEGLTPEDIAELEALLLDLKK